MTAAASDPSVRAGAARPPLAPLAPLTLVDRVVEAVVAAAAQGTFLPGDRVVEAEIARSLGVSRVPVREALRVLESQGIVVSVPYRGMRMMEVSRERIEQILEVRLQLENLAGRELIARARRAPELIEPLAAVVERMETAAERGDGYELATADTDFHRAFCAASGNEVLLRAWEPLSRQLTIIFGLSSLQKPLDSILHEHVELLEAVQARRWAPLEKLLRVHILDCVRALDYEGFVEGLRRHPTA